MKMINCSETEGLPIWRLPCPLWPPSPIYDGHLQKQQKYAQSLFWLFVSKYYCSAISNSVNGQVHGIDENIEMKNSRSLAMD